MVERSVMNEKNLPLIETIKITNKEMIHYGARLVEKSKSRYEKIELITGVPWYIVGALHLRESTCDFTKHLHNGDSLNRKTVRVPAGRPVEGEPPFTFEESAVDALKYYGWDRLNSLSGNDFLLELCYLVESFNGWGYHLYRGINSPYLWSGTNHYASGKYYADGKYDPNMVDGQSGVMAVIYELSDGFKDFKEKDMGKFVIHPDGYSCGNGKVLAEIDTVSDLVDVFLGEKVSGDMVLMFDGSTSVEPEPEPKVMLKRGDSGEGVKYLQRKLNAALLHAGRSTISIDGEFGPITESTVKWFQRVYNGHLTVDGIVGANTWAALETPTNIDTSKKDFYDVAKAEVGVTEYSSRYKEIVERYAKIFNTYNFSWCAAFVTWVLEECGVSVDVTPKGATHTLALVQEWVDWAKRNGRWHPGVSGIQKNDIVIFDWQRDGWTDHIGFFSHKENGLYVCCEGNVSDKVMIKNRSQSFISGHINVSGMDSVK